MTTDHYENKSLRIIFHGFARTLSRQFLQAKKDFSNNHTWIYTYIKLLKEPFKKAIFLIGVTFSSSRQTYFWSYFCPSLVLLLSDMQRRWEQGLLLSLQRGWTPDVRCGRKLNFTGSAEEATQSGVWWSVMRRGRLSVLSHHLKCEMKSPHLVDLSWDLVDFLVEVWVEFGPFLSRF